jgi:hypothetical protein
VRSLLNEHPAHADAAVIVTVHGAAARKETLDEELVKLLMKSGILR